MADVSEQEVSALVSKMLRKGSQSPLTLHVVYRHDKDYEVYARQILELREQVKEQKQQIYRFSIMGTELLEALDDVREARNLLKKLGVEWNPSSLRHH